MKSAPQFKALLAHDYFLFIGTSTHVARENKFIAAVATPDIPTLVRPHNVFIIKFHTNVAICTLLPFLSVTKKLS
jgi:hypothetical protein